MTIGNPNLTLRDARADLTFPGQADWARPDATTTCGQCAFWLVAEAWMRKTRSKAMCGKAIAPAARPPAFSDIDDENDIEIAIGKRINAENYGLRSEILHETDKAFLVRTPGRKQAWLAKSQVEHHGEDAIGRAILIVPMWLARKAGLL